MTGWVKCLAVKELGLTWRLDSLELICCVLGLRCEAFFVGAIESNTDPNQRFCFSSPGRMPLSQ
jgi:hypothetical protein